MTINIKSLAGALVLAVAGTVASAATVSHPYSEDPVFVGGFPKVSSFTIFGDGDDHTTGFAAGENLWAKTTVTQNRLIPLTVSYSLNGAGPVDLTFAGTIGEPGTSVLNVYMDVSDTLVFYVDGFVANNDSTLMTFNTTTTTPVPVPAAGFLLLGGLGALVAGRRKKA